METANLQIARIIAEKGEGGFPTTAQGHGENYQEKLNRYLSVVINTVRFLGLDISECALWSRI